jgi:hypothetical protein
MEGIDTTTRRGVYTGGEMLPLGNDKQADVANLHGPRGSPDPRPFGTDEDGIVPPHSLSLRDVDAPAPRADPRQILAGAIARAFFGRTDNIDDGAWDSVRTRLPTMTLREARGIWQRIANEVAVDWFDGNGHVDVERVGIWMEFLGNAEIFRGEPFCLIPHAELMRSQMHRVCECLLDNRNGARDQLDATIDIIPGEYGRSFLAAMSESPLDPAVAILASLLTPHRQFSLPTCAMDSLINAEIRNHPERLIQIYVQMLEGNQFTLPSKCTIQLQQVENGFIPVDLKNGGRGRNRLFKDITDGDRAKIDQQIEGWKQEGVEYVESTDEAEKYKLRLPIYNMNDVLFAHLFLTSNLGNSQIDNDNDDDYGFILIYSGNDVDDTTSLPTIQVDGSNFLDGMTKLKKHAEAQRQLGYHYMHVFTTKSGTPIGGPDHSWHAENFDIAALLALDPNSMEIGKAYPIGDRNWGGFGMSRDIPRLAVRKVMVRRGFGVSLMLRLVGRKADDIPTYEFGTLEGSTFQKEDISMFSVCSTEIKKFGSFRFFSRFFSSCKHIFKCLLFLSSQVGFNAGLLCFLHLISPITSSFFMVFLLFFSFAGLNIGFHRLISPLIF